MLRIQALGNSRWFEFVLRLALAIAFFVAGAIKLTEPGSLATVIRAFGLMPSFLVDPVAFAIPVLEIVLAAGVLARSRTADLAMAAMLAVFMLVLAYGMWLGLDVDCGCYGPGDPEAKAFASMSTSLVRDAFMFAACMFLLAKNRLAEINVGPGDEPALHTN